VFRWARDFMQQLQQVADDHNRSVSRLKATDREKILRSFRRARRRLLFLDYDGTLVPIVKNHRKAAPDADQLALLKKISTDSRNDLVIVTGRDRATIRDWIAIENCAFIAEHGAWIMEKNGQWQNLKTLNAQWKEQILPILEMYCDRLPGSSIEEKDFSLAWHFRNVEPELGLLRAKELTDYLINFTANQDLQIMQGKKVVETRISGISKGMAALHWLEAAEYDFILAAGDDVTDEDLFRVLPEKAFSLKVGLTASSARFNVMNHKEFITLLQELQET
jgi:trehalose 6-phosphate synthase/phosphatase